MTIEDELEAIKNYRKAQFQVKVQKERYNEDNDFQLRTSHNGYQWSAMTLNPDEAKKVVEALQDYLNNLQT